MAEEDDYMGDLSQFLPPESSLPNPPPLNPKFSSKSKTLKPANAKFSKKKLSREGERKLKQIKEDEQTLARTDSPIPQSNIGFKLLKQMGYTPGKALGKEESGRAEPVGIEIRRSRAGIGRDDPHKEKRKREAIMVERKRRKEMEMLEEFGSRQKEQWKSKRVIWNYEKAKKALDQLENKEIELAVENEDGPDEQAEEEEEVIITEEDLQQVLIKLREEYHYCLFCGCRYGSMEELLTSCPGIDEDDH